MSRAIVWQRCFRIPKEKLNVFLIHVGMSSSSMSKFEVEWVFDAGYGYDVVVNEYGHSYPYQENSIINFADKVCEQHKEEFEVAGD